MVYRQGWDICSIKRTERVSSQGRRYACIFFTRAESHIQSPFYTNGNQVWLSHACYLGIVCLREQMPGMFTCMNSPFSVEIRQSTMNLTRDKGCPTQLVETW